MASNNNNVTSINPGLSEPSLTDANASSSFQKVHKSAVCIIPPKELWPAIQEIRAKYDKAYERWPPHINLLYPFVPEDQFSEAQQRINLGSIQAFEITFKDITCFTHGKNSTLILKPNTKSNELFDLQKLLEKTFPFCDDLSIISSAGFSPHLTLGQFPTTDVQKAIMSIEKDWKPIMFQATEIHLISRTDTDPFSIKCSIPLGVENNNCLPPISLAPENNSPSATYQKEGSDGLLRIMLPYQSKGSTGHQILVVDSSGSMAGAPWKQVVDSMIFIKSLGGNPDVIIYHSTARTVTLDFVITCKESGMTNFGNAFDELKKLIHSCPSNNISVVFMTDGNDNETKDMPARLKELRFFINNCGKSVVVNTIGFGSGIQQKLLEDIKDLGTREGMFRFAQSTGLDEKFNELFMYSETAIPLELEVNGSNKYSVEAEIYDTYIEASVWLKDVQTINQLTAILKDTKHTLSVEVKPIDTIWKLLKLKNISIVTQEDLTNVQQQLNDFKLFKGLDKKERKQALEIRADFQEVLDKYHQILAEAAKNNTKSATLSSLRYEGKFTKARRQRLMNMRAAKNSKETSQIQAKLQSLKFSEKDFQNVDLETFTCDLLGEDVFSLMKEDYSDILGFGLNISRPEHGVEAPTQIVINEISHTFASQSAITEALKYKINLSGHESAHGGFSMQQSSAFQGRGREPINAFLPLYINEAHWNRVSVQLKPILGYFFTLDPLGYDDAQLVAIFTVLGHMVATSNNTERSKLMIKEFKMVCQQILPLATQYLGFDLVENFIKSSDGRRKSVVQNLTTVVGWVYAKEIDMQPLRLPIFEETYRRLFTNFFHAKSRALVLDHIKELLYVDLNKEVVVENKETNDGKNEQVSENEEEEKETKEEIEKDITNKEEEEDEETKIIRQVEKEILDDSTVTITTLPKVQDSLQSNKKLTLDMKFEKYALYTLGYSSRKGSEPQETVLVDTEFKALSIADVSHPQIQEKIQILLQSVDHSFMKNLFEKLGLSWDVDILLLRSMLVQSLRYCSNTLVNSAVSSGQYKNTWENPAEALTSMHDEFEKTRQQEHSNAVEEQKYLVLAKRTISCKNLFSFVGRLLKYCPTRGGKIFENIVSLLHDSMVKVPHRYDKLKILYTGCIQKGELEKPAIAKGMAWRAASSLVQQTKQILGEEKFSKLQVAMHGRIANHIYRLSNIPNRHGHSNLNPNPRLVYRFGYDAQL